VKLQPKIGDGILMMNDLKSTAYHEAGHAVMAWFCENRLGIITIKPDGSNAGSIQHQEDGPFPSLVDGHIWADQEIELTNGTKRPATAIELKFDDFASGVADKFNATEKEVLIAAAGEGAEKKFEPDGFNPIQSSQDWENVSGALEQLGGGARERLYSAAENLFDNPIVWAAVSALANELLARETLSSSEAILIIRQAIKLHLSQV
jgi:hypothetical protein